MHMTIKGRTLGRNVIHFLGRKRGLSCFLHIETVLGKGTVGAVQMTDGIERAGTLGRKVIHLQIKHVKKRGRVQMAAA
jgi:hypothetical protein